jgi:putative restriction endonuclease
MNEQTWRNWFERLYNLRRDKRGSHERPHKPVLRLAIIDLLDRGVITSNKILLSDELIASFKRHFAVVRKHDDQPSIQNPFYFLSGDGFWQLVPRRKESILYEPGSVSAAPSVAVLRRRVAFGRFDDAFWSLISDAHFRHQLREALIARYFPEQRDELAAVSAQPVSAARPDPLREEFLRGRDTAFRRTTLEIYDYRCAGCGIRVLLNQQISLVEAAHLIPFGISRNDKPDNGVALCPNHHWAMDRHLIAPCPDKRHRAGIWRVHSRLDDRIEGQKDLLALSGRPLIPPAEEKFYPSPEALQWRCEQLTTTY